MEDELVFIIVFCLALFFQVLFLISRNEKHLSTILGLAAALAWFTAGPVFIVAGQEWAFLAMFFMVLGTVNALFALLTVFKWMADLAFRSRRRGDLFE